MAQILYTGAKNKVIPQAIGVVGIITSWNFPFNLSFSVISAAFVADNRAMVKMSENSIHLIRLLKQISPKYFAIEKLVKWGSNYPNYLLTTYSLLVLA